MQQLRCSKLHKILTNTITSQKRRENDDEFGVTPHSLSCSSRNRWPPSERRCYGNSGNFVLPVSTAKMRFGANWTFRLWASDLVSLSLYRLHFPTRIAFRYASSKLFSWFLRRLEFDVIRYDFATTDDNNNSNDDDDGSEPNWEVSLCDQRAICH